VKPGFSGWIPLPLLALGLFLPGPGSVGPSLDAGEAPAIAQGIVSPSPGLVPTSPGEPAPAPPAVGADESLDALSLRADLARMVQAPGWRAAEWGVLAVSLERGDTLFALNAQTPLAPASNLKLFTSAAALERLGTDFRLPTFLLADGEIRDGVLHGDLILYGTGDPTLAGGQGAHRPEGAFLGFLETVQALGIHEVRGSIVGDGTFFQGDPRRPSWNPRNLNDWYAAPASALTFNENMVTLQVSPGVSAGAPARIRIQPEGASVPLRNLGRTVDRAPSPGLLLVRDDPDDAIEIRGEIARTGRDVWRSLTVSDPPAYAAGFFRQVLLSAGIGVTGPARAASGAGDHASRVTGRQLAAPAFGQVGAPRTLAVHHSPPLTHLVDVVNKRSHNLYADLLLFTLGHLGEGDATFEGGGRALTAYLVDEVGIPQDHLHVEDGSGLSRLNRASPASLVRLLQHMESAGTAAAFRASLPEAGNRLELRRMDRTAAAGNLRAKTGTIARTSALSGVVRTSDGETVFFSIMANNVPSTGAAKRVEDQIGARLAGFARGWDALPDLPPAGLGGHRSVTAQDRTGLHD
jgi:serine-type D-Ala-D-Ala carboxypeptidase/endopeptidase (penicillin-binding protein 4)